MTFSMTDDEAQELVADALRVLDDIRANLASDPDADMKETLVPRSSTMARLIKWDGGEHIEPRTIFMVIGALVGAGYERYARIVQETLDAPMPGEECEALH